MHADYIIAGGGLSGLLLAHAIIERHELAEKTLLIIEQGSGTSHRAVSFWIDENQLADVPYNATFKQWHAVRMRTSRTERVQPLERYVMCAFDYANYVSQLRRVLSKVQRVHFVHAHAERLADNTAQTSGTTYDAHYVFDSTSLYRRALGPYMHAVTFDVRGVRNGARSPMTFFDTSLWPGQAMFAYAMPSPSGCRLQVTAIAPTVHPSLRRRLDGAGRHYVRQYMSGGKIKITSQDYGIIPLRVRYDPDSGRPIPIGSNAGLIKATTGYAFTRMVSHAQNIAGGLAAGERIAAPRRSRLGVYSDAVLLRELQRNPGRLDELFAAIADRLTADQLFLWLDEEADRGAALRMAQAYCASRWAHWRRRR